MLLVLVVVVKNINNVVGNRGVKMELKELKVRLETLNIKQEQLWGLL